MASIHARRQKKNVGRRRRELKKQRRARARRLQRQLEALRQRSPSMIGKLLGAWAAAFTGPTYPRVVFLAVAVILTTGARTIANLLRTIDALAPGHPSTYHRVFSHRRWSGWTPARILADYIVQHFTAEGPVRLVGDDTVDEHRGKKVFGKGRHRDAVRSSHSYTAFRYGHKWVVLAILVKFPFARRPWALPVLVSLYRSPEEDRKQGRRHKTPCDLMRQMLKVMQRWFPDRKFEFAGDGGFGSHELARAAARSHGRLTLVSRFYPDANLYAPPPAVGDKRPNGRPRVKGAKLLTPAQAVKKAKRRQRLNVAWYGGGRRDVSVVVGTGHWYKSGEQLVPLRWVYVHDESGEHRDDYFFTTDLTLSPQAIIEIFTGRWSIETTFQEMRAYLGLETTRGWTKQTVLRMAPCLFLLYSVVAMLYAHLPARYAAARVIRWPGKKDVTFSDAITAVRRWLWQECVFAIPGHRAAFLKLPQPFQGMLLYGLAPAA